MMPSPKIAALASAPPENKLRKPITPPDLSAVVRVWISLKLTPGTTMLAPIR